MKKIITFICLILSIGFLSACGGGSEGKVQVTIGIWPNSLQTDDIAMFEEWKKRFEEDYPQYEIIGENYDYAPDTFTAMAQGNTVPTLFQTWFTEPQKLIKEGYVKDMTPYLEELGWIEKMDPIMKEILSDGDKIYGIPRDGYCLGLYLNLDVLEEAGVLEDLDGDGKVDIKDSEGNPLYPTTFDELRTMALTVTENLEESSKAKGFMILSANQTGGWQYSNIAWNFGATLQVENANGTYQASLNSPAAISAMEWIRDLKQEDDSLPNEVSLTYNDWYTKLGRGQVAMCFAGSDAISLPVSSGLLDKDSIAFVPMPAGPNGDQYALFGGTPYMFSSTASDDQIKGALKFLEYMGRSPEINDETKLSIESGFKTSEKKGDIIVPTIKAWINTDYVEYMESVENRYINVDIDYFKDFFDSLDDMKHGEEPYYAQEMYEMLDQTIQEVLGTKGQTVNITNLLTSNNNKFQTDYLGKINN